MIKMLSSDKLINDSEKMAINIIMWKMTSCAEKHISKNKRDKNCSWFSPSRRKQSCFHCVHNCEVTWTIEKEITRVLIHLNIFICSFSLHQKQKKNVSSKLSNLSLTEKKNAKAFSNSWKLLQSQTTRKNLLLFMYFNSNVK